MIHQPEPTMNRSRIVQSRKRGTACACISLLFTACGGGGPDAGIPATTQYAVQSAWRNLLNANASWTVTGTASDGKAYQIVFTAAPKPAAAFAPTGASGSVSEQFDRLTQNGTVLTSGTSHLYFNAATLAQLGSDNGDGTCNVSQSNTALPTVATVGATGAFESENQLASCSAGAAVTGSTVYTWSLEAEKGMALFCLDATEYDAAKVMVASGAQCFEMATDGTLGTHARVSLTVRGAFTLVARNY